jgi:hypothetical protein
MLVRMSYTGREKSSENIHFKIILLLDMFSWFETRNVPGTAVCLRLQVEPAQLGPIDKPWPSLKTPSPM